MRLAARVRAPSQAVGHRVATAARVASWAAALWGAALLASSCREADSVLVVTLDADANANIAAVVQVRAILSNASMSATNAFPGRLTTDAGIALPTQFSLTVPHGRTGSVDVAVDGLDAGGAVVANGAGSATLVPGGVTQLSVVLHAGAAACGNGHIDPGEQCDDGDRVSDAACDFLCHLPISGTGGGAGPDGGGAGGARGTGGMTGTGGTGAGGAPCTISLLTNGGFDAGPTGWTAASQNRLLIYNYASIDPSLSPAPRSSPDLAWLGYDSVSETVSLQQAIEIPGNVLSLTVSGYYIIHTDESPCDCDHATVDIVGSSIDHQVHAWSNIDANLEWTRFTNTFDVTPAAGTTVTLQVSATMDDGVNTSFYFDDLAVTANLCP